MKPHRTIRLVRNVANLAAILLLIGQTIAAGHFHSGSSQQEFLASSAGVVDIGCAICAAQAHIPAASAAAPALNTPCLLEHRVSFAVVEGPLKVLASYCFGRAPPASI